MTKQNQLSAVIHSFSPFTIHYYSWRPKPQRSGEHSKPNFLSHANTQRIVQNSELDFLYLYYLYIYLLYKFNFLEKSFFFHYTFWNPMLTWYFWIVKPKSKVHTFIEHLLNNIRYDTHLSPKLPFNHKSPTVTKSWLHNNFHDFRIKLIQFSNTTSVTSSTLSKMHLMC